MNSVDSSSLGEKHSVAEIVSSIPKDPDFQRLPGPLRYQRVENDHNQTFFMSVEVDQSASIPKPDTKVAINPDHHLFPELNTVSVDKINQHVQKEASTNLDIVFNEGADSELLQSIDQLDNLFTVQGPNLNDVNAIRLASTTTEDAIYIFHGDKDIADSKTDVTIITRRYEHGTPTYYIKRGGQQAVKIDNGAEKIFHKIANSANDVLQKVSTDIAGKTANANELQEYRNRRYLREKSDAGRSQESFNFHNTTEILDATNASAPIASFIKFPFDNV
ncbi:MAG: hypothetical protein WAV40_04750 [Microgenomates group bacterium]